MSGVKAFFYCGLLMVIALGFFLTNSAYAYLDGGTGSYIMQVLIGALLGGLVMIKLCWRNIKDFFINCLKPKKQ